MKKIVILALILLVFPFSIFAKNSIGRYEAEITSIENGQVTVRVLTDDKEGNEYPVTLFDEKQLTNQNIKEGDKVIVSIVTGLNQEPSVIIEDHVRKFSLLALFAIFLILVIVIGRLKGVLSVLGMFFSFLIIGQFIVPQIILGNDPLLITMLGALFIIPLTFYVGHGFKWQTTVAVISTFIALIMTGILAYIFVPFAKLTGFAAEEAVFIQSMTGGQAINIQSLLLAGIIIGAMGILDDITISQTSIVEKLIKANPKYSFWKVYKEAMDVGRDHISSLVNTLILVYAGASLPLFVLFFNSQLGGYSQVINMELVATEIVRTLVGSIGIISAVPLTTFIASWYIRGRKN